MTEEPTNAPDAGKKAAAPVRAVRRIGPIRLAITTAILLAAVIVWALLVQGKLSPQLVISSSMEPTIMRGDRIIVLHDEKDVELERDALVMVDLMDGQLPLLKRLVALPGDYVVIVRNQVFVNEQPSPRRLAPLGLGRVRFSWYFEMGEDEYFVIGDNRGNSFDSVDFGPVSRDQIAGHAVFRYWPPEKIGPISGEKMPPPDRRETLALVEP